MKNLDKEILPNIHNIKAQETYTLPSKGLVYSSEDKIGPSITLRRMTTKEDKIRLRSAPEDQIRKDLLQACILDENVDAGKLKLMDANFLLFRLRSLSLLDDTYKVACRCRNCGTEFVHEVNLLDVPVKYLTEDDLEYLHIELPISQAQIDFKYPSLNDIIKRSQEMSEYFDNFPNADRGEYLYTLSATLYLDKVNGHTLLNEEVGDYIDNLDILDSRALSNVVDILDSQFGFQNELKAKCPNCKEDVTHGLPITRELFSPSK